MWEKGTSVQIFFTLKKAFSLSTLANAVTKGTLLKNVTLLFLAPGEKNVYFRSI